MSHWANQYIGKAWQAGTDGPDAYDCYSFFRMVMREHYGLEVPAVSVDANNIKEAIRAFRDTDDAYSGWIEVDHPADGDAVLMAHARYPSHIGVWIVTPGMSGALHCVEGLGVVFSSLSSLNAAGWGKKQYWRYQWPA